MSAAALRCPHGSLHGALTRIKLVREDGHSWGTGEHFVLESRRADHVTLRTTVVDGRARARSALVAFSPENLHAACWRPTVLQVSCGTSFISSLKSLCVFPWWPWMTSMDYSETFRTEARANSSFSLRLRVLHLHATLISHVLQLERHGFCALM